MCMMAKGTTANESYAYLKLKFMEEKLEVS